MILTVSNGARKEAEARGLDVTVIAAQYVGATFLSRQDVLHYAAARSEPIPCLAVEPEVERAQRSNWFKPRRGIVEFVAVRHLAAISSTSTPDLIASSLRSVGVAASITASPSALRRSARSALKPWRLLRLLRLLPPPLLRQTRPRLPRRARRQHTRRARRRRTWRRWSPTSWRRSGSCPRSSSTRSSTPLRGPSTRCRRVRASSAASR